MGSGKMRTILLFALHVEDAAATRCARQHRVQVFNNQFATQRTQTTCHCWQRPPRAKSFEWFGSEHARQPATPNIYRYIKVYIENDKISLFVCLIFKWTHDRATYDNKCHNQMSWSRIIEIERIMVLLVCSKHSRYWYVERLNRSSEGEPLSWHFNFSNGRCELSAWNNGKKIQFPTSNDLIDFLRTRRFQYTLQPLSAVAPHKVSDIIKTVWWFCATRIKAEPEFSHVESDKMHHSPNRYRVVHTYAPSS